jgi:phospholipase C
LLVVSHCLRVRYSISVWPTRCCMVAAAAALAFRQWVYQRLWPQEATAVYVWSPTKDPGTLCNLRLKMAGRLGTQVLLMATAAAAVAAAAGTEQQQQRAQHTQHRSPERLAAIAELKRTLHTLTAEEASEAFARLGAAHRLRAPPPRQQKIDHFVVLYQENRAADHLLGCINGDRPGFDGIPTGGRLINKVPFDPSGGQVNVTCGTAPYVCGGADAEAEARTEGRGAGQQPLYDTFAGHFKPGSNAKKFPYAQQSDEYSYANGASGGSIQMFSSAQLPVKTAISEHYGVFNKLFCATPTSSTPNHVRKQLSIILSGSVG